MNRINKEARDFVKLKRIEEMSASIVEGCEALLRDAAFDEATGQERR